MSEIISVILSAIGVGILLYSLFHFILSLSNEKMIVSENNGETISDESVQQSTDKLKLNSWLKIFGFSLIILIAARMILSLSVIDHTSELFYYGLFVNILGLLAIVGLIFQWFRLGISELVAAFSIIFITLIVFIIDYVFL